MGLIKKTIADRFHVGGVLSAEVHRDGQLIQRVQTPNTVTDVGLDALLAGVFATPDSVAAGTWYLALRSNGAQTPQDTWAAKAWSEVTDYESASRPTWAAERQRSGVWTAEMSSYQVTADETVIRGGFLIDVAAKAAAGRLFMVAHFEQALVLYPGDELLARYTLTLGRPGDA